MASFSLSLCCAFFHPAKVKRVRVIGIVLLVMIAGIIWIAWQEETQTFALPDGNELYFRGVTAGTNMPMNFGSVADRILARVPGKFTQRFRRNIWVDETTTDSLVFWFQFKRPPSSNTAVEVQFVDRQRFRQFQPHLWLTAYPLPNGKVIATCGFPRWPRDEKSFHMEVIIEDSANWSDPDIKAEEPRKIGELTTENPTYRR
jgi:hypothetical protein